MPKKFYTEHDIEELFKSGIVCLEVNDNVQLTALAHEMANRLGMQLQRSPKPAPAALGHSCACKLQSPVATSSACLSELACEKPSPTESKPTHVSSQADLFERIKTVAVARLGEKIDQKLLETIIRRVLDQVQV